MWLRNGSSKTLGALQGVQHGCVTCTYPPGSIRKLELTTWQSAAQVWIRREAVEDVSLNARLFELSRRSQPQGVEVPIVRERDLLITPVYLLSIIVSETSRAALRIFDPFPTPEGSFFDVAVFAQDGSTLLGSVVVKTRHDPELVGQPGGFADAWTPAFAIIPDLGLAFPQLVGEERVHVRVTPLSSEDPFISSVPYWTMVSVTHNETQHVLLVTPQCCAPTASDE